MFLSKKLLFLLTLLALLGSGRPVAWAQEDTDTGQTKVFLPFVAGAQDQSAVALDELDDESADEVAVEEEMVIASAAKPIFGAYEAWTNEPYFGSRGTFFADVDKDGRADAIVVNNDKITVRRSTGSGFGAYEAWTNEPYFGSRGTFFADVDKDKRADAIVVNNDKITVRRSTGSGFGVYEVGTPQPYFGNRGTFFADVNKDGRADAIVVNDAGITVRRAK